MKKLNDPFAPTPESFRLSMERTLNGLEEREMTPKKFSAGLVFVLVLAMIIVTSVASAVISGGYVDGSGEYHDYSDSDADPEKLPPSPEEMEDAASYEELLDTMPRGEYWTVEQDGSTEGAISPFRLEDDMDELIRLAAGTELALPALPESCSVEGVLVSTDAEAEPYEEIPLEDGATLAKYRLTKPVPGGIDNYSAHIFTEDENYIFIAMEIIEPHGSPEDYWAVHVSGNGDYRSLNLPGWDNAVYIDEGGFGSVFLWRSLGDQALWGDIEWQGALTPEFFEALFSE